MNGLSKLLAAPLTKTPAKIASSLEQNSMHLRYVASSLATPKPAPTLHLRSPVQDSKERWHSLKSPASSSVPKASAQSAEPRIPQAAAVKLTGPDLRDPKTVVSASRDIAAMDVSLVSKLNALENLADQLSPTGFGYLSAKWMGRGIMLANISAEDKASLFEALVELAAQAPGPSEAETGLVHSIVESTHGADVEERTAVLRSVLEAWRELDISPRRLQIVESALSSFDPGPKAKAALGEAFEAARKRGKPQSAGELLVQPGKSATAELVVFRKIKALAESSDSLAFKERLLHEVREGFIAGLHHAARRGIVASSASDADKTSMLKALGTPAED